MHNPRVPDQSTIFSELVVMATRHFFIFNFFKQNCAIIEKMIRFNHKIFLNIKISLSTGPDQKRRNHL